MTLTEAYTLKGIAMTEKELAEIKLKKANDVIISHINEQAIPPEPNDKCI